MKFSVIVSIENNYELITNFIETLTLETDFTNGELIVAVDGCRDSGVINFLQDKKNKKIISHLLIWPERKGYSIANNKASKAATGEYLIFINSDVLIQKGAIEHMILYLDENFEAGAVQARLIYPQNNKIQSTGHLFERYYNAHVYQGERASAPKVMKIAARQALTTAFCAIRRNLFIELGGFDECYYNAYEGMELTLRITLIGQKCIYLPAAVGYHITGGTRNKIAFDDAYAGHMFWARWHNLIKCDLGYYLRPQVSDFMTKNCYFLVYCSSLPWWEEVLKDLGFSINGKTVITDRFNSQINLYTALPYDTLRYAGNLLFVCDSISALAQNHNWSKVRRNYEDIVLDAHGNIDKLSKITGVITDDTQ